MTYTARSTLLIARRRRKHAPVFSMASASAGRTRQRERRWTGQGQVITLPGKLCSVARIIPKSLERPVQAGGHYSGAVVIPDVRRPYRVGDGHARMQAT